VFKVALGNSMAKLIIDIPLLAVRFRRKHGQGTVLVNVSRMDPEKDQVIAIGRKVSVQFYRNLFTWIIIHGETGFIQDGRTLSNEAWVGKSQAQMINESSSGWWWLPPSDVGDCCVALQETNRQKQKAHAEGRIYQLLYRTHSFNLTNPLLALVSFSIPPTQ
jgi:hypothetical protein